MTKLRLKDAANYTFWLRRFLTRLLLVHGSLSAYRLSRLIKYSFYKNVAFGFMLFFYQFYCGFSGQSLVDSISAAAFNVIFTSLPILLYSVLDRPVHNLNTLLRYPQVCRPHTAVAPYTAPMVNRHATTFFISAYLCMAHLQLLPQLRQQSPSLWTLGNSGEQKKVMPVQRNERSVYTCVIVPVLQASALLRPCDACRCTTRGHR